MQQCGDDVDDQRGRRDALVLQELGQCLIITRCSLALVEPSIPPFRVIPATVAQELVLLEILVPVLVQARVAVGEVVAAVLVLVAAVAAVAGAVMVAAVAVAFIIVIVGVGAAPCVVVVGAVALVVLLLVDLRLLFVCPPYPSCGSSRFLWA